MMFGTNDCQAAEIPPDKFRANLEELVRKIRASGAIPLLQTPNAIASEPAVAAAHIKSRAALPEYVSVIKEVAEKGRLVLVDHWTYWQGRSEAGENYLSWLDDPLHPNAAGHREMARLIFKDLDIYDPRAFTCTGVKN
jgi:lysophospholipase L1-like esterase